MYVTLPLRSEIRHYSYDLTHLMLLVYIVNPLCDEVVSGFRKQLAMISNVLLNS